MRADDPTLPALFRLSPSSVNAPDEKKNVMSLGTILLIIPVIALLGASLDSEAALSTEWDITAEADSVSS
jgi:hypothetical protein